MDQVEWIRERQEWDLLATSVSVQQSIGKSRLWPSPALPNDPRASSETPPLYKE